MNTNHMKETQGDAYTFIKYDTVCYNVSFSSLSTIMIVPALADQLYTMNNAMNKTINVTQR